MNVQNDADRLVEDYQRRLAKAAEPLPESRRTELLAEVTAHIAEARAEGAASESEIREMLTRLGTPDEIVAAATDGLVLVDLGPRFRRREVAALMLLTVGGFVFLVGWAIGVALLWGSDRWTRNEKVLGTLLWPFGYAFIGLLVNYFTLDSLTWLARIGLIIIFVTQTATTSMLVRNAGPRRG